MDEAPRRGKVLVVDDSETVLQWVRLVLRRDYDVIARTNPLGTGAAVIREQPDLVLLDVDMPLVEGDQVVTSIRKSEFGRETVVALFSGLDPAVLVDKARKCGANGVIRKTSDPNEFIDQISKLLGVKEKRSSPASFKPALVNEEVSDARLIIVAGSETLSSAQLVNLSGNGLEVRPIDTAAEVYEALRMAQTKLVIAGTDLADVSAAELCETIRSDRDLCGVSILLLEKGKRSLAINTAKPPRANTILTEPVSPEELHNAVSKLINVAPRRNVRVLVRTRSMGHGDLHHHGISHNLSVSGMLLETAQAVEIGDQLMVHFFVPGSRSEVATTAEIVRHHAQDGERRIVGMRFLGMRPMQQTAIASFVEQPQMRAAS
jgi:DNA-binding response OmpR family regulator